MTAKNAEGYPDPTAEEAIRHVMRGGKLDYTSFRTYEELQDYTIEHNKGINTREAADKFIREKMPKESYFQKKILDWIKDNAPNAIAWKEAAGPYSRQGIPDITCIINGRYYGFEVKRPFIGVLSKMQEQTIKQIRKAGGRAWVVTSEKEVAEILLPELMSICSVILPREQHTASPLEALMAAVMHNAVKAKKGVEGDDPEKKDEKADEDIQKGD